MVISSLYSRVLHKYACHIYELLRSTRLCSRPRAFWMLSNASYNGVLASGFSYSKQRSSKATTSARRRMRLYEYAYSAADTLRRRASGCLGHCSILRAASFTWPPYIDTNQGHYKGYLRKHYEQLLHLLSGLKGKFILSSFPKRSATGCRIGVRLGAACF